MAGLFQMPSPEMVRQNTRQGLFNQAQQIARAPQGRGFVQSAAQAGGLFGEALGRGMGGATPGELQAQKFQQVQQQITDQYKDVDLTDPMNQIQMMGDSAKLLMDAGFGDQAAQALQMANQIRSTLPKTKPQERYEPIYGPNGQILAQREVSTNKVITDPRAPKDPDTLINNYLGDQDELAKSLSKELGKNIVDARTKAKTAAEALKQSNEAIDLLNSGVITGTGANWILNAGKFVRRMGFNAFEDDVKNTEAFAANMGRATLAILGSGALGAGTGISDNDRKFAKQIAAGEITLDENSIRRIIELNQKVNMNVLNAFNSDIDKIPKQSLPFDLKIAIPEVKSTEKAMSDDEYNARKQRLGL